ncbi:hypothetical protein LEN26_015436 [Aphanomyces euteiches]|nr:hypothetical protein LEN26_015436 [Aphanomyces euteiches]KAH9126247.1 hypothetical protein AeMF1_003314 [Aphanomyces euteiches]
MRCCERPLKALPSSDDSLKGPLDRRLEPVDSDDTCTESTGSDVGDGDLNDDKAIVVLSTAELLPLETDVDDELYSMSRDIHSSDWLVQYNAIECFRRGLVHHAHEASEYFPEVVDAIQAASLNLRSAMSKNALLAFAETFEYAPDVASQVNCRLVVDALLKRAACEKKFLRDAADYALAKMASCAPSTSILLACASVADSKSGKLGAAGCNATVLCLQEMQRRSMTLDNAESGGKLVQQLVKFRSGKDVKTREDALRGCTITSHLVGGIDAYDKLVTSSVSSKTVAIKLIADTKMALSGRALSKTPSTGSSSQGLRERLEHRRKSVR